MSAKTKIVVLHMKEVVYTVIFLVLALLLGVLLFLMFGPARTQSASADGGALYHPGVYTSTIAINENTFDLEVTVDSSRIKSVRLINLSESTTAMFPLMEPTLDDLASQLYATQSLDQISYSDENKYTSLILINAISTALKKAEI